MHLKNVLATPIHSNRRERPNQRNKTDRHSPMPAAVMGPSRVDQVRARQEWSRPVDCVNRKNTYMRLLHGYVLFVYSFILGIGFYSETATAGESNVIVLDKRYARYTVTNGRMGYAYVRLAGAQSVESFQNEHSLNVDGVIGKNTWNKLDETLRRKGIEVKLHHPPIGLVITVAENKRICFEIQNRTTNHVIIKAGTSLYQRKLIGQLFIPVSVKVSGEDHGRLFDGPGKMILQLELPAHIAPLSSIRLFKSYREIGEGDTSIRVSMVGTEDEKHVFLLDTEPLFLRKNVVFLD